VSTNRTICLTNKLFTYLLAGTPFVATDTPGQRPVVDALPKVAQSYGPGATDEFVDAVTTLFGRNGLRDAALTAARNRYRWDVEKRHFLDVVASVVGS
jgi:glycosyltransferase involved in cell wall biosynthesis